MEIQADPVTGCLMIIFMAAQVLILKSQTTWGPRWFVPESWRRNPNAYYYNRQLSRDLFDDEEAGRAEEMICVICMNAVRFEVDASGSIVEAPKLLESASQPKSSFLGMFSRSTSAAISGTE